MQNRVFFPQALLDEWIVDGSVDLREAELTILAEGRKYAVTEAVRVLREVTGAGDSSELVGRVKSRTHLEELGAELVESSMLLGDVAYDVEPGWVGTPVGAFADHLESDARKSARNGHRGGNGGSVGDERHASGGSSAGPPESDEDLLQRFVAKDL